MRVNHSSCMYHILAASWEERGLMLVSDYIFLTVSAYYLVELLVYASRLFLDRDMHHREGANDRSLKAAPSLFVPCMPSSARFYTSSNSWASYFLRGPRLLKSYICFGMEK